MTSIQKLRTTEIPEDIKTLSRWLLGKDNETFSAFGKRAKSDDRRAWGTYEQCLANVQSVAANAMLFHPKGALVPEVYIIGNEGEAQEHEPLLSCDQDASQHAQIIEPSTYQPEVVVDPVEPDSEAIEPITTQEIGMVSGFGQFHTNEPDPTDPSKQLEPYVAITRAEFQKQVDEPWRGDKKKTQWVITSSLRSRKFNLQETEGSFLALPVDFDIDPQPISRVAEVIEQITGGADYEIYNTSSATVDQPKSRALIWLDKPLTGRDYVTVVPILNDKLQSHGLIADRAIERAGQLLYLPNRGDHYETRSQREGVLFDPLTHWADEIAAKRKDIADAEAELNAKRLEAQTRKAAMAKQQSTGGIDLIPAFNNAYTAQDLLIRHDYEQRGNTFRHPNSKSGSFSASVKDGRVHALSTSDPLCTNGKGAHDAFSVFTVLEHGGDLDSALKDAGDNWLTIGGESWNKVHQREYAKKKADAEVVGVDIQPILDQKNNTGGSGDQTPDNNPPPPPPPVDLPDPVDLYSEYAVPEYPLHCLPKVIADYSTAQSQSTGFDAGGYASVSLASYGGLIDHRGRIKASSTWSEPPMKDTAVIEDSGGGKTHVLKSGTRPITRIGNEIVRKSAEAQSRWRKDYEAWASADKKTRAENPPERPAWNQLVLNDATTESMADVLAGNPRGVTLVVDEMTGLIGSLDAYSNGGKGGASKDRAAFLRLHDGGEWVINRKLSGNTVISNWAASIITSVQPAMLGEMVGKSSGGGADGLFQRFLPCCMKPPKPLNLYFEINPFVITAIDLIADQINQWTIDGKFLEIQPNLSEAATRLFQDYCNAITKIAQGTDQQRFKEHLSKFKGFLLRLCFVLHVVECASTQPPQLTSTVSEETFKRAQTIMECQYHHSFAVYEAIGRDTAVPKLARQVGEAILAIGWRRFTWGDLTRDVSYWRDTHDVRIQTAVLDRLEAFGWIQEVDIESDGKKAGRKSKGTFNVNPAVHTKFSQYAQRKYAERAQRREAFDVTTGRLKTKNT